MARFEDIFLGFFRSFFAVGCHPKFVGTQKTWQVIIITHKIDVRLFSNWKEYGKIIFIQTGEWSSWHVLRIFFRFFWSFFRFFRSFFAVGCHPNFVKDRLTSRGNCADKMHQVITPCVETLQTDKISFQFLSHGMGSDPGDSFPFDFEPYRNTFGL